MSLFRKVLLAGAQSEWLREQSTRRKFVRRAVSRFMPGETLDAAVTASGSLKEEGMTTILTQLGENIKDKPEADEVLKHYLKVLTRVHSEGLDAEVSVKLTQLGLDLSQEMATDNLKQLAEKADQLGNRLWVDMEDSTYTDATLEVFNKVQAEHKKMALAIQSCLFRTKDDLDGLIERGAGVRLVKGAYLESPEVAYPDKKDVDENFFNLAKRMLSTEALQKGSWAVFGTHDGGLIQRIRTYAQSQSVTTDDFEFDLLYGIAREEQQRLIQEGCKVRILVSYGEYWFPWYMRRLAERPANVLFVVKNMFSR
jgi:proline dehydrogenase